MLSGAGGFWQVAAPGGPAAALASLAAGAYISPVLDRMLGVLLFLPVPVVLWLFTRTPAGTLGSLGLGVFLMVTHRFYARPFALGRAGRRCLWCGGAAGDGPALAIAEPLGTVTWRACSENHRERLSRLLGWAERRAGSLRLGILGALGVFLVAMPFAGLGRLEPVSGADVVALFKLGVSLTVLPLGWLAVRRASPAGDKLAAPFPVHIQALIGTWAVLWLFRLVGLLWLAQALWHFGGRVLR
jgi:hypothetical protein